MCKCVCFQARNMGEPERFFVYSMMLTAASSKDET